MKKKPTVKKAVATKVATKTFTPSELKSLTKTQIISELIKSPHGELGEYVQVGMEASQRDPHFFAHLVRWNGVKGSIRDSKKALPIISLVDQTDSEYAENALAHLAALSPRDLVTALNFSRTLRTPQRTLRRLVERYLREKEAKYGTLEAAIIRHKQSLLELYAKYHVKPSELAQGALFSGKIQTPKQGALKQLQTASPEQVAGLIGKFKLPYLNVRAALGARAKEEDILVALIGAMTPSELTTNMKSLERLGVKTIPAARAALDAALTRAASKPSTATVFKAERAAEALEDDEQLSIKLRQLQEKQIEKLGGVDGNWLVLADKSGSMSAAIEAAVQGAAYLARLVKGNVYLVFFDTTPTFFDVTGKTLEEIKKLTKGIRADGGTSIGCGLRAIIDRKLQIDGIAIFTDGGENNTPYLYQEYPRYVAAMGNEPTVYYYGVGGYSTASERSMKSAGVDVQTFDIKGADYYSLPNLIQTMRVGRYGLLDEVLATDLLTLDEVLPQTKGFKVLTPEFSIPSQVIGAMRGA